MLNKTILVLPVAAFAAACATTPKATVGYHLAESVVDIEVTRTLACTSDDKLISVEGATVTVSHRADPVAVKTVNTQDFGHWFSDSELTIDYYSDGRLKGLNAEATGKGKAILDSALSAVTGLISYTAMTDETRASMGAICAAINTDPKDGKLKKGRTATLTYKSSTAIDESHIQGGSLGFSMSAESFATYVKLFQASDQIQNLIGPVVGYLVAPDAAVTAQIPSLYKNNSDASNSISLTMRRAKAMGVFITTGPGDALEQNDIHLEDLVVVATKGDGSEYNIAIPRPAFFGGQTFDLTVAESGAVEKIGYGVTSGTSDAFASIESIDEATSGETYAEKAAEIQARANYLAQQQRLAVCLATPEECK